MVKLVRNAWMLVEGFNAFVMEKLRFVNIFYVLFLV